MTTTKLYDLRLSSLIKVVNALGITLQEFFHEGF